MYETGQPVGGQGRKWKNPEKKKHLAHAQAELGLSHMCPEPRQNELTCAELCFCMAGESFHNPEIGKQSYGDDYFI